MRIGVLTVELFIGEANSLKDKRRILKSLLDKLKKRFNIAAAEVGKQDMWKRSTVGISCISNDSAHIHQIMATVMRFIENQGNLQVIDYNTEVL